mgnify:CR=1 FL=1
MHICTRYYLETNKKEKVNLQLYDDEQLTFRERKREKKQTKALLVFN